MGKVGQAEEIFKRAIEINPDDLNVIVNYANLKRDLNQMEESLKYYEKGFNLNNNHETLLINYAGAFQVTGDFESQKNLKITSPKISTQHCSSIKCIVDQIHI